MKRTLKTLAAFTAVMVMLLQAGLAAPAAEAGENDQSILTEQTKAAAELQTEEESEAAESAEGADTALVSSATETAQDETEALTALPTDPTDSASSWAREELRSAIARGIVPEELQSSWQQAITRREFCLLLACLLPETSGTAFRDCSDPAVVTCAALGVVTGYPDGTFRPDESLTRQQAAVMLMRAAKVLDPTAAAGLSLHVFADMGSIGAWAAEGVSWAWENGVMEGTGSGCFSPKTAYTREQSVLTVQRMLSGGSAEETVLRTLNTKSGSVTVCQETSGSLTRRICEFADGTDVTMGRVIGSAGAQIVWAAEITGGWLRWYENGKWTCTGVREGTFSASCIFVDASEGSSFWLYTPLEYRLRESDCLEQLADGSGTLRIVQTGSGYLLTLWAAATEAGAVSDFTAMSCPSRIVQTWTSGVLDSMSDYALTGSGRWCYDGYYYITPSSYTPSGENVFYANPAFYIGKSLSETITEYSTGTNLTCMLLTMCDTMCQNQNSEGYWPIKTESSWLSGSYGITGGYYDTRWNSDLMRIFYNTWLLTGADTLLSAMERYADYYESMAESRHRVTASGGWYVDDYTGAGMTGGRTHTSLNHQLAEAEALYYLSTVLDRDSLKTLADRLIDAVCDSGSRWLSEDGNLYYSFASDGTYGGTDYPSLTYDDLVRVRLLLTDRGGSSSSIRVLNTLISSKLAWMKKNGVSTDSD